MNLFLDMDGVLADFIRGACDVHGLNYYETLDSWTPGKWDDISRMIDAPDGVSPAAHFWREIERQGESFWRFLSPTPWLEMLMSMAGKVDSGEWHIVTMISDCHHSASGKVAWIKSHMGPWFNRFYLCRHSKEHLSAPGRLLIDDKDENVDRWVNYGGKAILWPAKWNRNHKIYDEGDDVVLDYVREMMDNKCGVVVNDYRNA